MKEKLQRFTGIDTFKEFLMLNIGTLLVAAGVYFFKFPNNFSTGGVSGIAIVLGHYFPSLTPGTFVSILNYLLLAACILGQWQLRLWLYRLKIKKAAPNRRALLIWRRVQWHCRLRKIEPPQELLGLAQKARFSPYTLTEEELALLRNWTEGSVGALRSKPVYIRLAATLVLALY